MFRRIFNDPKFRTDNSPGVVLNLGLVRHLSGDDAAALSWYDEGLHVPGSSAKQRRLAAANAAPRDYAGLRSSPPLAAGSATSRWVARRHDG